MAVTAIASESATAEGVPESPSFDESRKVVAAVSEESNSVMETSKKRKRPTASLLKHAMEELDSIWINAETDAGDEADTEDDDHGERMATKNHPNRNRHQVPEQELCPADLFRVRQTSSLLVKVLTQDIHEPAIRALVENEELKASQMKLKTELESSQKEVERLRRSEQRSKEAIKNLLKAVGTSAEETKDASQSKLLEAKMRADLLHVISERDAAKKISMVAQRSVDLLEGNVENLKKEKAKLQHDKLRLEREVRAARALADGLSSSLLKSDHHQDDLEYYKRRSSDLEAHIQGMTALMAEKNQELQELRRCRNRNLSQQRLEALRAAGEPSTKSVGAKTKRPRRSELDFD